MVKREEKAELQSYPLKICIAKAISTSEKNIDTTSKEEKTAFVSLTSKISIACELSSNQYFTLALSLAITQPGNTLSDHFIYQLAAEDRIYSLITSKKKLEGVRKIEWPNNSELSVEYFSEFPKLQKLLVETFLQLAHQSITIEHLQLFLGVVKSMQTILLNQEEKPQSLLDTFRKPILSLFTALSINCKFPNDITRLVIEYDDRALLFS